MTQEDRDAAVAALAGYRDRRFAELLVVAMGLAAETHSEELRAALASVFDLDAVEERTRQINAVVQQHAEAAAKAHYALEDLRAEYAALDRKAADIEERVKHLFAGVDRAAAKQCPEDVRQELARLRRLAATLESQIKQMFDSLKVLKARA